MIGTVSNAHGETVRAGWCVEYRVAVAGKPGDGGPACRETWMPAVVLDFDRADGSVLARPVSGGDPVWLRAAEWRVCRRLHPEGGAK